MPYFSSKKSFSVYLLIGISVALAIGGCKPWRGSSSDPIASTISINARPVLSTTELPAKGGIITIKALVKASQGVQSVHARITSRHSAITDSVDMTQQSGETYWCKYSTAPNSDLDGKAQTYTVIATATDSLGHKVESEGASFKVDAARHDKRTNTKSHSRL